LTRDLVFDLLLPFGGMKMNAPNIRTKNLDHHGLVAGFCKEVGIARLIDKALPEQSPDKKVSYGQLLEAMILNGLGFTGRTLHMYSQYFEDKPLERLLGEGIQPADINDDALGRCLDKLFEHGVSELYQILGEAVVSHLGLPCEGINMDTTSFHVDGAYAVDDDFTGVHLTRGYSRDHRPELNQVILSLITENQAGIPVYMKAHSGNSNDSETFKKLVKSHIKSLKAAQTCRYLIGDSSLYTSEIINNLALQLQYFITRVPQKIVEVKELLANLDTLNFSELNNGYQGAFVDSDYSGIKQKWLVVRSEQAKKREIKTLENRIEKSMMTSNKAFKKLCNLTFSCRADALKSLDVWVAKQTFAELASSNIEEITKHSGRGRPAKGAEGTKLYQIKGALQCSADKKQAAETNLGVFILATNDVSGQLDMQSMLDNYKSQQKVEGGFRFLKSPDFLVSSLFLKKPQRIEALLMVMTCCLMVYAALEYQIRTNLQKTSSYFPDMKNKPYQKPTARWVFQNFQGIHELVIDEAKQQVFITNLLDKHLAIINCLGNVYRKIYSIN